MKREALRDPLKWRYTDMHGGKGEEGGESPGEEVAKLRDSQLFPEREDILTHQPQGEPESFLLSSIKEDLSYLFPLFCFCIPIPEP